jgi:ADP-L-glycero-D-manno-heptose 6-epimerase
MIVITGAAGFIGSHLCRKFNLHGIKNLILVDDFTQENKRKNWENLEYSDKIQREHFFQWAEQNVQHIDFIFHLGARTDYFSTDNEIFEVLNVDFSQRMWSFATFKRIPLIYASSYLTNNAHHHSSFAKSKYIFDKWI